VILDALAADFVPLAVDQHIHRRLRNAEGELFAHILKQAGRDLGGRSQGVYIAHPNGTLLAFANTADATHVRRLMDQAKEKFAQAARENPFKPSSAARFSMAPPQGTLVLAVASKILGGFGDTDDPRTAIHASSVGRDLLWVTKEELAALLADDFPTSLLHRIARFHLVDNTRGEPPFWRQEDLVEASAELAQGRITGQVTLRSGDGQRSYTAELGGRVEAEDGSLTAFHLVALGTFSGEGQYTRGAPEGEFPFAVAIRQIGVDPALPAHRIPPGAARSGTAHYLP
jgi:hypothetical protein